MENYHVSILIYGIALLLAEYIRTGAILESTMAWCTFLTSVSKRRLQVGLEYRLFREDQRQESNVYIKIYWG